MSDLEMEEKPGSPVQEQEDLAQDENVEAEVRKQDRNTEKVKGRKDSPSRKREKEVEDGGKSSKRHHREGTDDRKEDRREGRREERREGRREERREKREERRAEKREETTEEMKEERTDEAVEGDVEDKGETTSKKSEAAADKPEDDRPAKGESSRRERDRDSRSKRQRSLERRDSRSYRNRSPGRGGRYRPRSRSRSRNRDRRSTRVRDRSRDRGTRSRRRSRSPRRRSTSRSRRDRSDSRRRSSRSRSSERRREKRKRSESPDKSSTPAGIPAALSANPQTSLLSALTLINQLKGTLPGAVNPLGLATLNTLMGLPQAAAVAAAKAPAVTAVGGGVLPIPPPVAVVTPTDPATKLQREIFVGNVPPGTTEVAIQTFLNAAMHEMKLNTSPGNPIVTCRLNPKFAFVELRSVEEASNMLNLTGIPFMGNYLRIGRPTKYTGPQTEHKTWQELKGEAPLPSDALAVTDSATKVARELFIGNTPPGVDEKVFVEFLGAAMEQVHLTTAPGNPIVTARMNDKYAFVELRSVEEANNMLSLNGIPFMGQNLKVGRPAKYTGPQGPVKSWDEVVAEAMANKSLGLTLKNPSKIIKLANLVSSPQGMEEGEWDELGEEINDECAKYGKVVSYHVQKPGEEGKEVPALGCVFVEFENTEEAAKALGALHGRLFDGKNVICTFYSEENYQGKVFQ